MPPLFPKKYWKVLDQSARVAQERETQYGDATENFAKIRKILFELFGINLSEEVLAQVFIATKFARNFHQSKEDNIIDAINYLAILNLFENEK